MKNILFFIQWAFFSAKNDFTTSTEETHVETFKTIESRKKMFSPPLIPIGAGNITNYSPFTRSIRNYSRTNSLSQVLNGYNSNEEDRNTKQRALNNEEDVNYSYRVSDNYKDQDKLIPINIERRSETNGKTEDNESIADTVKSSTLPNVNNYASSVANSYTFKCQNPSSRLKAVMDWVRTEVETTDKRYLDIRKRKEEFLNASYTAKNNEYNNYVIQESMYLRVQLNDILSKKTKNNELDSAQVKKIKELHTKMNLIISKGQNAIQKNYISQQKETMEFRTKEAKAYKEYMKELLCKFVEYIQADQSENEKMAAKTFGILPDKGAAHGREHFQMFLNDFKLKLDGLAQNGLIEMSDDSTSRNTIVEKPYSMNNK